MNSNRTQSTRTERARGFMIAAARVLICGPAAALESPSLGGDDPQAIAAARSELTLEQRVQAAYWRGRTCSTPACKAARSSGMADVAGFGLAAFGGVWLSRRRTS